MDTNRITVMLDDAQEKAIRTRNAWHWPFRNIFLLIMASVSLVLEQQPH
jgi:hypothetical protein